MESKFGHKKAPSSGAGKVLFGVGEDDWKVNVEGVIPIAGLMENSQGK